MLKMHQRLLLGGFLVAAGLACSVKPLFAATAFLETKTKELAKDQIIEVGFFIDTEEESINAVEAKLRFPADLLEVKDINDGGSIINFWLERPKKISAYEIAFSGIIPGGYSNAQGLFFTTKFLTKTEGSGRLEISEIKVLRHDGQGTAISLNVPSLPFSISRLAPSLEPAISPAEDTEPPESFSVEVSRDQLIFGNRYFIVFATQDKNSGLDRYEVREGNGDFAVAFSPHLLKNQALNEDITVVAIDKRGNKRITTLPASAPRLPSTGSSLPAILILGFFLVSLICILVWKKIQKR